MGSSRLFSKSVNSAHLCRWWLIRQGTQKSGLATALSCLLESDLSGVQSETGDPQHCEECMV